MKIFIETEKKENRLCSPITIRYCLNLLSKASRGETRRQIQKLTGADMPPAHYNIDKVVSMVNAIFINDRKADQLREAFICDVSKNNLADIIIDPFRSVTCLNRWLREKTFGMIPAALSRISPEEDMLICSVLALDMPWQEHYFGLSYGTFPFYTDRGMISAKKLELDYRSEHAAIKERPGLTALSFDLKAYEALQLEAVILMPDDIDQYLEAEAFFELVNESYDLVPLSEIDEDLRIILPAFTLNDEVDLKKELMAADVQDIFDPKKSDMTGMFKDGGHVSDIIHHNVLYFNEKGIRAASYTSGIIAVYDMPKEKRTICIDHPFLFLLREKNTGEIWFQGVVYEPDGADGFGSKKKVKI